MRYLPHTASDRQAMLDSIGVPSVDDLFKDVPDTARLTDNIKGLPSHKTESEVERHLTALASKNMPAGSVPFFLGAGAYRHYIPAAVDHLIQRGEFLTSYTPYQPEVAQGTLQYLFEFQTQVALLTGMEVANASMYDGSTACAEAVAMANRITKRNRAILSGGLHPHYRDVVQTQAKWTGYEAISASPNLFNKENILALLDDDVSCVVMQTPDVFGHLNDFTQLAEAVHSIGALLIVVVTEIVSLGLLTPPGDMGADIVVAEGQSLGNGLNFGGPYVGLFATREKFIRQMPGRLAGETIDADGRRGYVLTLSTREQHIRREKATSNICTNSGLCALAFTIHLSLLGETGLMHLAQLNHEAAVELAEQLARIPGVDIINHGFFNEFTVKLPQDAAEIVDRLAAKNILGGVPVSRLYADQPDLSSYLLVTVTETVTPKDCATLVDALTEILS